MRHILRFLGLSLLALSLSCVGGVSPYPAYLTHALDQHTKVLNTIPVYVDGKFTYAQEQEIENVVNEWNYVLNGYIRIEVEDWKFDSESDTGKKITETVEKTHQGIIVYSATEDDSRLPADFGDPEGVLAFVDPDLGDGAHALFVFTDHMGNRSWHQILLHEFGHALGAHHVYVPSLMFPYYGHVPYVGYLQVNCVDQTTSLQVATYHHLQLSHMNYCTVPE